MRYIITILIFIAFIGCDSSSDNKNKKEVVKESSPSNVKRDKTPPTIPEI